MGWVEPDPTTWAGLLQWTSPLFTSNVNSGEANATNKEGGGGGEGRRLTCGGVEAVLMEATTLLSRWHCYWLAMILLLLPLPPLFFSSFVFSFFFFPFLLLFSLFSSLHSSLISSPLSFCSLSSLIVSLSVFFFSFPFPCFYRQK